MLQPVQQRGHRARITESMPSHAFRVSRRKAGARGITGEVGERFVGVRAARGYTQTPRSCHPSGSR